MVRTVTLALALTILPGFAVAQQEEAPASSDGVTATVVEGTSLRDLARRYYGDADLWTRIHEANRDRIQDPDRLEAGQSLRIPDPERGEARFVRVVADEGTPARVGVADVVVAGTSVSREQQVPRGPKTLDRRTVFWPDTTRGIGIAGAAETEYMAVATDIFYRTPWLLPDGESHGAVGEVASFAGAEEIRADVSTVRPFDEILVTLESGEPAVGSRFQVYRLGDRIEGAGSVVQPTGVITVRSIEEHGVLAVVDEVYHRMTVGDLVLPLPEFPLEMGQEAVEVDGGLEAEIVGFADPHELQAPGDIVFLDRGSDDGVSVGDEFTVVWSGAPGWTGQAEGRIQAVRVGPDHTSARIVHLENPVFVRGVQVRLSRRMP